MNEPSADEVPVPEASVRDAYDEASLIALIEASQSSESVVRTSLKTDDRVLARVTDGIYRQPASALRELISNAYDADATRVTIHSDAPRFERLLIEDNGHGMTPVTLANLLLHIGGSAKRNEKGQHLGVTSKDDPFKSPEGRTLIGKIGIGLFAVSQLTHSFQIVTKVRNDPFRTTATVVLRQYSDSQLPDAAGEFESGRVNIWRERADDLETHGTAIVLTNVRTQARDTLRSRDVWAAIEQAEATPIEEERQSIEPPQFHVGRVGTTGDLLQPHDGEFSRVPWSTTDTPAEAFKRLVDAVWTVADRTTPNPRLDRIFDYYLQMLWQLGLSAPLPYVDGHLFDEPMDGWANYFRLSNEPRGAASGIDPDPSTTLRNVLDLRDRTEPGSEFRVFFDNLELRRPIRFRDLPTTAHALKKPIVFVGKCREDFPGIPTELSAGPLEFEAYLFWNPKIAPTEHQGALVRIHGASGSLFDPTFMRYQISEQTRLRQTSAEIFVSQGLDGALNIDRESFNQAHPHAVYITRWLHSALRQLATAQKRLAAESRDAARAATREAALSGIQQIAVDVWRSEVDDPAAMPPGIELTPSRTPHPDLSDTYQFPRNVVVPEEPPLTGARAKARRTIAEERLRSIGQVLASFGLLDRLPQPKRERLLRAIYRILIAPED